MKRLKKFGSTVKRHIRKWKRIGGLGFEKLNFENDTAFKSFIEWLDDYMTEMEETKLFIKG